MYMQYNSTHTYVYIYTHIELEDRFMPISLYGIALDPVDNKDGHVTELTRQQIFRLARRLYPELYGWNMRLHYVKPQPISVRFSLHVLAKFLPDHHDTGNEVPTLVDLRWYSTSQLHREMREAKYYPTPASWDVFMDGLQDRCHPVGPFQCTVWVKEYPCLEGIDASTHRGDLVSIRLLPTWTEELGREVSIRNGQEFYETCIAMTPREMVQSLRINLLTALDTHSYSFIGGFHINTLLEIGLRAQQLWGRDYCLDFSASPSNLRDGLFLTITQAGSDAVPVVLERRVIPDGYSVRRHLSLMLALHGSDLASSIADHTEHYWHGSTGSRTIAVNGRLLNEREVSCYYPNPADHIVIAIPDPGHRILSSDEAMGGTEDSDDSFLTQIAIRIFPFRQLQPQNPLPADHFCMPVEDNSVSGTLLGDNDGVRGGDERYATAVTLGRPLPTVEVCNLHSETYCQPMEQPLCQVTGSLSTHVIDRWCDSLSLVDSSDQCPTVELGLQDVSKDQVGPSILTCRPNADITLEFDDFIPLPNGGRIIPPPNWRQNSLLRYASNNDAVFRDRQGFLTVDCRTWLLPHGGGGHRQPRDLRIQAQLLIHLVERIRHLWRDVVAPGDALRVQHVRPTPLARGNQRQSPKLHLLVEVNRPLGDFSRPILLSFQQISAQGLSSEVDWLPCLSGDVVTLQSILQVSSLGCESRNLLVPLADRARGWLGTQQQRHVAPGAYIPVWWDLRWNADPEPAPRGEAIDTPVDPHDHDDLSLMQRAQCSDTPTSEGHRTVHTFRISAKHRFVSLQLNDIEITQQLMQAWQATRRDPIVAYHRVMETPTDLVGTSDDVLLLEFASDAERRLRTDDALLLVDIYLQGTGPDDTQWFRRVVWGRHLMSHQDIL